MSKSIFYHAGCPVCVSAEQDIVNLIGNKQVEIVNIGAVSYTHLTLPTKA